jgi:D-inositol-3-phosphate glycosyltransferase
VIGGPYPLGPDRIQSGGELNRLRVCEGLAALGVEVDVFTTAPGSTAGTVERERLRVHYVPEQAGVSRDPMRACQVQGAATVEQILRHQSFWMHAYDCIHTHHWACGIPLTAALPAQIPLIHTPHLLAREKGLLRSNGCPPDIASGEAALLARSQVIIAVSEAEARAIANHYPGEAEKIVVAPNGVDEMFGFIPTARKGHSKTHVATVGRVCHQKGTDVAVEAIRILRASGTDARLTVAGAFYGEKAFEEALGPQLRDVEGSVSLAGALHRNQVAELYRAAGIYVQPSRYESQCISLLEAMAAGCIVVASRLPALEEYVVDGVNGLLVPPDNAGALAGAISEILDSSESALAELRRAARSTAERFPWSDTVAKIHRLVGLAASTSGEGVGNDRLRQKRLRRAAKVVARAAAGRPGVHAAFLTGSVARGTVDASSDIDLHLIVDEATDFFPPWTFRRSGLIYNLHQLPLAPLRRASEERNELAIAQWLDQSRVGDELSGAILLEAKDREAMAALAAQLVELRGRDSVVGQIVNQSVDDARGLAGQARDAARDKRILTSQHFLRQAVQRLLTATLVRSGWRIRGAKRRPELACSYYSCQFTRETLAILFDVVGLSPVTPASAIEIAQRRLRLRQLYAAALEGRRGCASDGPGGELAAAVADHERHAFDYYLPAIASGHYRGVVNHIRALSSFPWIPFRLAEAVGAPAEEALEWFASTPDLARPSLVGAWLEIADLSGSFESCIGASDRIFRLAERWEEGPGA